MNPLRYSTLLVAALLAPTAVSAVTYSHDDGIFENEHGNSSIGFKSLVALHHFFTQPGANLITDIQVAWPAIGLVNGDLATVVLWDDPNLDGDPNDATVLASTTTPVQLLGTGTFVNVDIVDTLVGSSFFVGTRIEKNTIDALAGRMADTSAPISGEAWFADSLGSSVDLNNLSSATFFGNFPAADWGIRATGVPEVSTIAAGGSLALVVGLELLRQRRAAAKC